MYFLIPILNNFKLFSWFGYYFNQIVFTKPDCQSLKLLLLLSVSASFSRNTMDFPCIFGVGKFYFYSFIFSWQIAISALYTVDLYLSYIMSSLC